jgi:hypothetical protein
MNAKSFIAIAALAVVASTAARADDITINNTPFQSVRTRADVRSELAKFKQAGVNPWSISYNQLAQFNSIKTREAVLAEFRAGRDQAAVLTGEDSGSAFLAQAARTRTVGITIAGVPANGQ